MVLCGGVPLVGPQEELRGLSGYTPREFTSSRRREEKKGFRGLQQQTNLKSETQVEKEKVHSSSAARCGGTWDLDPVDFFLRDFFYWIFFVWGIGPCRLPHPPPLE